MPLPGQAAAAKGSAHTIPDHEARSTGPELHRERARTVLRKAGLAA